MKNKTKEQIQNTLDEDFDLIYSDKIRNLSKRHWTPIKIIKASVDFLCYKENLKILDIGSGPGKFCTIAALLDKSNFFYGVDYRKEYIDISNNLKYMYEIENTSFVNSNFMDIDFKNFNGIYFFNSFHEQIDDFTISDENFEASYDLYKKYTQGLFYKLNAMPEGTRLVTYHTNDLFIPHSYRLVAKHFGDILKCYIKIDNEQKIIIGYEPSINN